MVCLDFNQYNKQITTACCLRHFLWLLDLGWTGYANSFIHTFHMSWCRFRLVLSNSCSGCVSDPLAFVLHATFIRQSLVPEQPKRVSPVFYRLLLHCSFVTLSLFVGFVDLLIYYVTNIVHFVMLCIVPALRHVCRRTHWIHLRTFSHPPQVRLLVSRPHSVGDIGRVLSGRSDPIWSFFFADRARPVKKNSFIIIWSACVVGSIL